MNSALFGVRVIDLSESDAGASCAEALAWLGADVIKIEDTRRGNSIRQAATEKPGVDSYAFILLNANKRSVTCDIETESGRKILSKLITKADVLIEDLAPGAIEHMGFGYDTVQKLNAQIIYARIKGFASDGPYAHYLSSDMVAQAVGGALSVTGNEGGPPLIPGPTIGATGAALNGAMGILAALHQRRTIGQGQKIEVAMQDAVINVSRIVYQSVMSQGKPRKRMGNAGGGGATPSGLFRCKPGGPNDYVFIHIALSAPKHWQALLKVIGREDLLNDPRFSDAQTRSEHRKDVDELVSAWCQQHNKIEVMQAIQRAGATAGAVLDTQELSNDADLRKRGMLVTIEHPVRGVVTMPGWPVKMSESSVPVVSAPPLGAHTEEVLSEWLDLGTTTKEQSTIKPDGFRSSPKPAARRALSGVRVVDLTQYEAGPSCTETLAWLGADVVKIEEPRGGDRGRLVGATKSGVDSTYFVLLNANKRSLTCDLKSEPGKETLRKLIMEADVMIENMAPGAIERLGFGYETVKQLNPGIIFAQLKGFAADSPQANYLCFDAIAQAVGGSVSITGPERAVPLKPGVNIGDTGAGMYCTTGILAALFQRQMTGRGQKVEVAMQEAVINFSRSAFAAYLATGKAPERRGDRGAPGGHGPNALYQCSGGGSNDYCVIDTSEIGDEAWQSMLRIIDRQDLINDRRFLTTHERIKHTSEIEALLSAWCLKHGKNEAMEMLQGAGVPAGAVFDTREISESLHLRNSGMLATVEHPTLGTLTIPACPVKMSESQVPVACAPLLGTDTEAVLSEWLGTNSKDSKLEKRPADA